MKTKARTSRTAYVCASCGSESLRWAGKCPACGQWGTLEEQVIEAGSMSGGTSASRIIPATVVDMSAITQKKQQGRRSLGIGEVDRVLGGGLVSGEVVLLAGEPGIGKSTLLLQVALRVAESKDRKEHRILYVSGEESLTQLASRVARLRQSKELGTSESKISVSDETDVDRIVAAVYKMKPALVIVDSVQSLSCADVGSFPGSITQVRECGIRLTQCAKKSEIPFVVIGQVTKEGVIAGPKVLEHVVDAVVYFEGDDMGVFRVLRCIKNRFGTTEEVGIFEMTGTGLAEVPDPSEVFGVRGAQRSGSAISAVYKGSRTLFVEVQALTAPAPFGAPRRISSGFNKQRLEMICAVLSRRAHIQLNDEDVFVNVSGGMTIDDPSADLAVCMAIVSAKKDKALDRSHVFVGEVSLSGEIRRVPFYSRIEAEAKRRKLSITGASADGSIDVSDVIKSNLTQQTGRS